MSQPGYPGAPAHQGYPAQPGQPGHPGQAGQAGGPQVPFEEPRPHPLAAVGTMLWRAGIGALAVNFALTGADETMATESLSYLSNLTTGLCFLGLAAWPLVTGFRRTEPRTAWLRSTLMIMMVLVAFVWIPGMGEEPDGPHALIPALVMLDWLFVGRSQFRARWWEPPTWTAFLLCYLAYHRANDLGLYPEILGEDKVATMVPIMLGATIVAAYVFFGAARLRKVMSPVGRQM